MRSRSASCSCVSPMSARSSAMRRPTSLVTRSASSCFATRRRSAHDDQRNIPRYDGVHDEHPHPHRDHARRRRAARAGRLQEQGGAAGPCFERRGARYRARPELPPTFCHRRRRAAEVPGLEAKLAADKAYQGVWQAPRADLNLFLTLVSELLAEGQASGSIITAASSKKRRTRQSRCSSSLAGRPPPGGVQRRVEGQLDAVKPEPHLGAWAPWKKGDRSTTSPASRRGSADDRRTSRAHRRQVGGRPDPWSGKPGPRCALARGRGDESADWRCSGRSSEPVRQVLRARRQGRPADAHTTPACEPRSKLVEDVGLDEPWRDKPGRRIPSRRSTRTSPTRSAPRSSALPRQGRARGSGGVGVPLTTNGRIDSKAITPGEQAHTFPFATTTSTARAS